MMKEYRKQRKKKNMMKSMINLFQNRKMASEIIIIWKKAHSRYICPKQQEEVLSKKVKLV